MTTTPAPRARASVPAAPVPAPPAHTAPAAEDRPPGEPIPGSLEGNVPYLFDKLEEAFLSPQERMVAVAILWRSYRACPPFEEWDEVTGPGGSNPWLGWAKVDQRELAGKIRVNAKSPGSFSDLLKDLTEKLRILERGPGARFQYYRVRAPCDWHPDVFDEEKARARHERRGAGRPPNTPRPGPEAPPPQPPRRERRQDLPADAPPPAREHLPLEEADVAAALADLELAPRAVANCWAFVRHFQLTVEPFHVEWLPVLATLVTERRMPPSLLMRELDRLLSAWRPDNPWGYLVSTVERAPVLRRATSETSTSTSDGASEEREEEGTHDEQDTAAAPKRRRANGRARGGRGRAPGAAPGRGADAAGVDFDAYFADDPGADVADVGHQPAFARAGRAARAVV